MGRPKLPPDQKRPEVKIYPERTVLSWVDEQVALKRFWNRTHAFEAGIYYLRKRDEEIAAANATKASPPAKAEGNLARRAQR